MNGDALVAVGLLLGKWWGVGAFIVVAMSQIVAYTFFHELFGRHVELLTFHVLTLSIYIYLRFLTPKSYDNRSLPSTESEI